MFMGNIGDIIKNATKLTSSSNETYCRIVGELEQYIQSEVMDYVESDDVRIMIGSHWLSIRLPDWIQWDAGDLLTVELRFNCKFVETTPLTRYRQYEFEWV